MRPFSEKPGDCSRNLYLLKVKVNERLEAFKKSRSINKKRASNTVLFTSILNGSTILILSLNDIIPQKTKLLGIIAIFFTIVSTILANWDNFFNHKRLWEIYTIAIAELYKVKNRIEFLEQLGDFSQDDIAILYISYERAISILNSDWLALRKQINNDKK